MKLKITTSFRYAHFGYQFVDYTAGSEVEVDDAEMVEVAIREGWAEPASKPHAAAHDGAPENAAHDSAPKKKPKKP